MQTSAPFSWDQYSSNESDEGEKNNNELITEATNQLFLRRYSSFPLSKENLLAVFAESNYDDDIIKQKLDDKLADQQKNKQKKQQAPPNKKSNNFYYGDNRKKAQKKKFHKKKNFFKGGKKHYKTELLEVPCDFDGEKTEKEPEEEKQADLIDLNDLKKEIDDCEDDLKTSTTLSKGMDLSSQTSSEFKPGPEEKKEE